MNRNILPFSSIRTALVIGNDDTNTRSSKGNRFPKSKGMFPSCLGNIFCLFPILICTCKKKYTSKF